MSGGNIVEDKAPYEQLIRYISSLSEEERETYKDLIDEALKRDELLAENCRQGKKNAERFAESMKNLMETVLDIQSNISRIYEKMSEIKDASDAASQLPLDNGPCLN